MLNGIFLGKTNFNPTKINNYKVLFRIVFISCKGTLILNSKLKSKHNARDTDFLS